MHFKGKETNQRNAQDQQKREQACADNLGQRLNIIGSLSGGVLNARLGVSAIYLVWLQITNFHASDYERKNNGN